ncbi:MAG: hypothetical protein JST66_15200 [Bacteroidetes bacterium]|nr:hypothetical protein [Bacteroidota bacterium]
MRPATLLLACSLALGAAGQVSPGHQALAGQLQALTAARTDAQRDSLSGRIKEELRTLLDADDAFTASFTDVPMSRVDAPDGRFRLFTWNVPHDDGTHLYEGFLLVRNKDRRVLYELRDMTDHLAVPATKKLSPENWYGALYYAVIAKEKGDVTYYTLLGWKGYSKVETRKVIEVLSFNGPVPTFGAMIFDEGKIKHLRKVYGYNFQSTMSLKWDAANNAIVLDHLAPLNPEFSGENALMGPDLSFDAYVWYKERWTFMRDVDARNLQQTKPSKRPPPPPRP